MKVKAVSESDNICRNCYIASTIWFSKYYGVFTELLSILYCKHHRKKLKKHDISFPSAGFCLELERTERFSFFFARNDIASFICLLGADQITAIKTYSKSTDGGLKEY